MNAAAIAQLVITLLPLVLDDANHLAAILVHAHDAVRSAQASPDGNADPANVAALEAIADMLMPEPAAETAVKTAEQIAPPGVAAAAPPPAPEPEAAPAPVADIAPAVDGAPTPPVLHAD